MGYPTGLWDIQCDGVVSVSVGYISHGVSHATVAHAMGYPIGHPTDGFVSCPVGYAMGHPGRFYGGSWAISS